MALLNPTFICGIFVLAYLSSFVIFAVLRILTGLSIQRIGLSSLRRLAYVPKDGVRIEVRSLGFKIHRPTFAQPTWISIVLNELVVTVDVQELEASKAAKRKVADDTETEDGSDSNGTRDDKAKLLPKQRKSKSTQSTRRSETWKQLTNIKERIKILHRRVKWLRMIDVVATNSTVNVVEVGSIQVGSLTVAVDTRRKMVDRARFFFQRHSAKKQSRQAEWIATMRSILFTVDGGESLEVLDHAYLNIHGFLFETREGLRDATVSLKLGRLHIPYDDAHLCVQRYRQIKKDSKPCATPAATDDETPDIFLGSPAPGPRESEAGSNEKIMQTVSDSTEFLSSILRGVKEVQFALGLIVLNKRVDSVNPGAGGPVQLHAVMKEVGVDLHRLDPKSPAHRMYFPATDIAHEALAAALSIAVGLDDGHGKPERLVYIPMATTTVKTTLPSKTVELSADGSAAEKNANILFANSVITSPSVDIDPRHLPIIIALLRPKPKMARTRKEKRNTLISRLLPKANVKFSMHEPVLRIKLKPLKQTEDLDDYDLIISSISSISIDMESSHSTVEDSHYAIDGAFRLQTHNLYYHTNSGERFNLITTDSFDVKTHLTAKPDVCLEVTGSIQSFSLSMMRPEITDGLRQIVRELRIDVEPDFKAAPRTPKQRNFLRSMPEWLLRAQFDASDFTIEVAGVDDDISDETRGAAIHLDTFSAEYRAQKLDGLERRPPPRRRTHSRSITTSDSDLTSSALPSPRLRRRGAMVGDGRRLTLHARNLEAQIIEAFDKLDPDPFLRLPRFELALSAASDGRGAMFHISSSIRTIMLQYSLYRHYAVGVAVLTLRKAFMRTSRDAPRHREQGTFVPQDHLAPPATPGGLGDADDMTTVDGELLVVDIKAALLQIKAQLPHEPPLMLHIYGLETGRLRWSTPYLTSRLIRLYTETPRVRNVWVKMVSLKGARIDMRRSKKRLALGGYAEEKMIDITTEAMRLAVPHEVVVAKIVDNVISTAKSVQQLHHRFQTGTNEYILEKHPEGPKHVPKISLRSRKLLFEMEDGAFEWKLGMIYRAGKIEQMQRLAREEAFKVKSKRVREEESRRGGSKIRSRSQRARGREEAHNASSYFRSRSLDALRQPDGTRILSGGRVPRYDPEREVLGVNGGAKVSESEARMHLDSFNAQTWKKRIDRMTKQSEDSMRELRETFWGSNHLPDEVDESETILEVPPRPSLMSAMITDLRFEVDKPTFAMKELPDFLNKVGKGMPRDMQYSLLVPMHVLIEMGEARVSLRDYPLPLLHIPGLKVGQSSRIPSVSLRTNFVLAEEFRGPESIKRVKVNIIPPKDPNPETSNEGSFAIEVRRTVNTVKSYSDVFMDINSALPTRITWGPSYQPAIQDMMMVIESFTKPQVDPSERVGFWDKLRLIFHSRIHVAWKGDGDMHLSLKGTRDPYHVTGNGAGFLMCWRNEVKWNINVESDPKRFMTVESGEYVLAIPDFSHHVRDAARRLEADHTHAYEDTFKAGTIFKKVVMKLSGKVQWMAGLIFEQAIVDGKRNFSFRPHYDVVLKHPHFAKPDDDLPYDAMRGFRSRFIHLSIAVRAPVDRDWMGSNSEPSRSYNTVHLTPRFFTHFFSWWALFSGPMSLPIRQGSLFPGREKNSKKFGRHLATVKYNLSLAPLFLSHIYKHKDVEDYAENQVSATGLKVRFESFMLDLHQRREEFNTMEKGKDGPSRTSGIKIHAAQLDLANADVRAVSASIKGTTTEAIQKGDFNALITDQRDNPDLSHFTIPDHDYSWIDMDDFVELDWILPTEPHPDTRILPLAFAPRLTYFRQTDVGGTIAGDPSRTSPFGNEPTHFCIMTHDDDPKKVQAQMVGHRLTQLDTQMQSHARTVGEAELNMIRCDSKDTNLVDDYDALRKHTHVLKEKKHFLESMLQQMEHKTPRGRKQHRAHGDDSSETSIEVDLDGEGDPDETINIPKAAEFASEYKNRFVVHNMQLKWNNLLRNIVLRYVHQSSQRRGFIYYLSRPAVKFILDIVDEQNRVKAERRQKGAPADGTESSSPSEPNGDGPTRQTDEDLAERIRKIVNDGQRFMNTTVGANEDGTMGILDNDISDEFSPQAAYHVRLIAPQIQLQSDKNKKHVVLVTAKGMELKMLEVMDNERISDNVSGLVQRRFLANMDSTQFFVTHQKWFSTNLVSMYAGSKYGAPSGSSWPPWVPMEVMFDFNADPFGFKRVVQKTSAMLRYDKYNTLRLKYNDEVNCENEDANANETSDTRMDSLWVDFPQARALCNSSQYYALYVIVLDLLMYSEPLEKTRSERLEKIMLASDFSDLSGAPQMVMKLQERIRSLEEIKTHFQIYSQYLDKRGWEDRLQLERDLAACEDELFFMMKAITTSQRKLELHSDNNALLKWSISARDIVWHLMQDSNEPLVELQLKDLEYDRTDHADGSHMNLIRVGRILGLNLLPDATYPEIIASYHDGERAPPQDGENQDMIRVYWYMLEAIAGITVMDRFEVDLHPMKIQLERQVGKQLFNYIFPGMSQEGDGKTSGKDSPFMLKPSMMNVEDDDQESANSSTSRLDSSSTLDRDKDSPSFSTRAGSLELRLQPTLSSNTTSFSPEKDSKKTLSIHSSESRSFHLFKSNTSKTLAKKSSWDSLRSGGSNLPRVGSGIPRSSTGLSSRDGRESLPGDKKGGRFSRKSKGAQDDKQHDDLSKMVTRASNYMTFAHIKIPSVVLNLSYKGREQRNIEDVHDFVFRLPTIEWQNKTWSNLDLALAMKKAVMKALISHTGAIIGNKFSKHRPNAEQRNKLRELANSSVLIAPSPSTGYAGSVNDSDDSSLYGNSLVDYSRSPPRSIRGGSTHSSIPAPKSTSRSSSVASTRSHHNGGSSTKPSVPAYLTMTPPSPEEGRNGSQGPGIDLLRTGTNGSADAVPLGRRALGNSTGADGRPSTSHSTDSDRRRSGGGLREKITALRDKIGHREGSNLTEVMDASDERGKKASPRPKIGQS